MTATSTDPGHITDTRAVLARLRRIEGQVRGLERMVDADADCIDILTQVAAATRALESVALTLLDAHMRRCVVEAGQAPDADVRVKVDEAMGAVTRLVRS